MSELDNAVVVDFPLQGEWQAYHTPASRIPSHGTDLLAQRYAFDFVRTDPSRRGWNLHPAGRFRTYLIGVRTSECYAWGATTHAVLDGVVVQAVDGVPERAWLHPAREIARALWNGLTFDPKGDLRKIIGNNVIVAHGDVYAVFVHLVPGSVAVTKGQEVRSGDLLGRVGHTGNSTAPHLHFQLMDGLDPLTAKGVPCAFAAYEVQRGGAWERVERSIPSNTDRIRSVHG